jgi:hypothetical protein
MGAAESRLPPGYVMQEFYVGQPVMYNSDHGFRVRGTITSKQFQQAHNCYVYGVQQVR